MKNDEKAVTAFICGGKGDHEHNNEGEVLFWNTGEVTEDTPEIRAEMDAKGSWCNGGSACCSICGSSAFDRHAMTGFDDGWSEEENKMDKHEQTETELATLKAQNAILRAAVEHYASRLNWSRKPGIKRGEGQRIVYDPFNCPKSNCRGRWIGGEIMSKETDEILRQIEELPDDTFLRTNNPVKRQYVYSDDLKRLAAEFREMKELLDAATHIELWFPNPDKPNKGTSADIAISRHRNKIEYHSMGDLPGEADTIFDAYRAIKAQPTDVSTMTDD